MTTHHIMAGLGHTTLADTEAAMLSFLGSNLGPGDAWMVYVDAEGKLVARRVDYLLATDELIQAVKSTPQPGTSASAVQIDEQGNVSTSVSAPISVLGGH